jgi:hypothetical protein
MTPMKITAYITIILIASLLFVVVQTASAQDIVSGVNPGDQFTYSVTGSYSSDAPLANVPEEVINAAASAYFKITIANVSNPNVGYTWLWHFTNGTDQTGDGITNIEIPSENIGPFPLIVSANLTTDESIHPHFGPRSTFNETVMWTYTNYTRETNRLETQFVEQNNQTEVTKYRAVNRDTYFDKRTGMLVQLNDNTDYQNPTFTTTIAWKLIGQNVWTFASAGSYPPTPFFTLPVIIAIIIVIAILVVALGFVLSNKRRNAKRKQLLKKK